MKCRIPDYSLLSRKVYVLRASQEALVVKNPPASAWHVTDRSMVTGSQMPCEKSMATHSSVLAWRILGTEEPGRL